MAAQSQTVAQNATAVQISGDGNSVKIIRAGAELSLSRLHNRRAEPQTTIELLRTDIRATKFVGRETQCRQLAEWRASPQPIAVLCFTGGAGAGKTRLAIEACETAEAAGWAAGFARSEELARFHATQNLVHWALDRDTLIVIDYAATSLALLKSWFAAIAPERNREGHKLRILLLERQADPENGWWADLNRRESADRAGPADLIGHAALHPLPQLEATHDRRALLAETMRKVAPLLDPPAPVQTPPTPGEDAWFDKRLADDRIGNEPLYLMMAGVHAARHGATAALALDWLELAGSMASIETARLERFARSRRYTDDGAILKHLAACITLQNGCSFASLPALIEEETEALKLRLPFSEEAIAGHLCDCLPSSGDNIEPVRPDLIGESFLLPIVNGGRFRSEAMRRDIVLRAYRRSAAGTVDTLVRCARDMAGGSADHGSVQWLRAIAGYSDDVDELVRIADLLPQQTLALREFALDVTNRIVAVLKASAEQHRDDVNPQLARALINNSLRQNALGRHEEALAAALGALRLYRPLASARPNAFAPDLAASLNNVAGYLGTLGRHEEALAAAEEAVRTRRALAAVRPDIFRPDLATSLNNLANLLSALGRHEQALAAAEEAAQMRRALATVRPDIFRPDLAASLITLANSLSALGRLEEALAATEEAARLYRALVGVRADAFTPRLASSLNNLSGSLSALGRSEEALAVAEEALRLCRVLAEARPEAFMSDLAMSLQNVAVFLGALGRLQEATAAAEEAVGLLRGLAAINPQVFMPHLAMSLNNLGVRLGRLGRVEDALAAAQESLQLRRVLVAARPDVFMPDLAMSLKNIANNFAALGRRADALAAAEEAVELHRALAKARPGAFTSELAGSLNNVANRLGDLGQHEGALAAAEEAVRLRRVLAAARPEAFTPDLAMSLAVLGDALGNLGRATDAVPFAEEAVRLLRPFFLQQPMAFAGNIAAYSQGYVRHARQAGQEPDMALLRPIAEALSGTKSFRYDALQ
jgi:tetratricopeptide (TPR) repeat protein